jgi:hypothetical protein
MDPKAVQDLNIRTLTILLDAVGTTRIDNFELCSFAVETLTGTSGSVVLSTSPRDADTNSIPITPGKAQAVGRTGITTWYIHNRTAQTGKTLVITIGGPGTNVSPGYSTAVGSASAENQVVQIALETAAVADLDELTAALATNLTSLAFGQVAVGLTQVQLTAQAIADGFQVVIKASVNNTGIVYLGITGVLTTTGFELSAGESMALKITNLNKVFAIADAALQSVSWIVEKAA